MSERPGSSRTMGPVKQCAVVLRGGRRCFGCNRRLRAPGSDGGRDTIAATIDHYDGDGRNHAASNLLPACRTCNSIRRFADCWEAQLSRHGETPTQAAERARVQLAQPLDLDAGRELAAEWHPERRMNCNRYQKTWKARRAGTIPPVDAFP